DAQCLQRSKTSDAEEQLLPNADAPIAAIKTRSKFPVFGCVAVNIRVEKEEVASAHFEPPHFCADRAAACLGLNRHRPPVRADRQFYRQTIYIRWKVFLALPSAGIDTLPEVSLAVQQTDSDERYIEIRSALDVIARKNSKSSRIYGNRFVQPELGR